MDANLLEMQKNKDKDIVSVTLDLKNKKAKLPPLKDEIDSLQKTITQLKSEMDITQTKLSAIEKLQKKIEDSRKALTLAQDQKNQIQSDMESLDFLFKESDGRYESDIDNAPEENKVAITEQRVMAQQKYEADKKPLPCSLRILPIKQLKPGRVWKLPCLS